MNLFPLALYAAAMVAYAWHFAQRNAAIGRAATTLLVAGALSHTFVIGMQTMEVGHVPVAGATSAIGTFVWLLALSYLYVEMTTDERAMGVFILPLLVALQAIPAFRPGVEAPAAVLQGPLFGVHVSSLLFAYASFALACVIGCWSLRCFIALVLPSFVAPADASFYAAFAENCTFTRLDTISMGCLLALAARSDGWRRCLDRLTRPALMLAYFAAICVAVTLGASAKFYLCVYYSFTAACIALLTWGLIRSEGLAGRILSHRILTTIGVGSYSIYLWQQLFIHPKQSGWIHAFPQNIVLSLGAASLSYWIIEQPFNRLKNRLAG